MAQLWELEAINGLEMPLQGQVWISVQFRVKMGTGENIRAVSLFVPKLRTL